MLSETATLLPETATLGELLSMRSIPWQLSRREQQRTIVTQHDIADIVVEGERVRLRFSKSAKKPINPPVVWEWIPTASSLELRTDDAMTLQPCGSYFGPNESYALIPDTSMFWLSPDKWVSRPDRRSR